MSGQPKGDTMPTHRERVLAAFRHRNPDRIPVDISGTGATQINFEAYGKLKAYLSIDTQHVLPFGTPDDVRHEVKRRVADLADGGGYVVGSVHNIQAEVPPQNVMAMVDTAHEMR